ncbi:hypothetical protein BH20ACT24_BH20ACT24_24310 [soil metagenome]
MPTPVSSVRVPGDLSAQHGACALCGRPTPLGVSLCEEHNPGRLGAPSATQAHGTIVAGIVAGFVLLAVVGRIAFLGSGPFESRLSSAVGRSDGGVDVVIDVTNRGSRDAGATCRVTRGGLPSREDLVFLSEPVPPGGTRSFSRTVLPPEEGSPPYRLDRLVVSCT